MKRTYVIYGGCCFNTKTALKCLWQCTEVLYILTYVIVVRGRKKQNHGDTSIQCTKRKVKSRFNFSVWFAMRKSGNLYIVLLIELQGHVEKVLSFILLFYSRFRKQEPVRGEKGAIEK